ncbi:bifunctional DNA primase/polymerase-like protein [Saccharopolyspora erythraea NRRL 2338]|uniref:Uncharacterized protein n=2 Tax=Saccharopolyspora erythraea TaxID=1836 RepID=A4FQ64_SACEN|nr:bifunctional DNA primase/polymerase [Saccharopolyspora erythraea]EQD84381.1 hypothetical protein N599_20225 [Saccharopolyspora erythraea D]PFG92789.1 bifunctional DNA primase/polymerase-like protein [Saccharopolyspora erythraea NRRL 2338]PFG99835.1 bifunctional DNA primase/polymerase-like protein [Saccharopolyspora erythraea NRRL 2338]QRK89705.1 bifunctional DNA primase/polymerase [Saccharopolyspora erythraea]CAM06189.1 hypothetical protein SACE_7028 [Saccharopolyspora erythraea NRRL 2338]
MTDPIRLAHWLIEHGMYVFPLRPYSKRPFGNCRRCKDNRCTQPCPCLTADRPCHGYLAATNQHRRARRWFTRMPAANVGISTDLSDTVVLDLDRKPKAPAAAAHDVPILVADGLGALDAITTHEGADWPDTLTIATPSEGRHLYFRRPAGLEVASDANGRVGHQIDIRAQGGYVVAPGCQITAPPEDVFGTYTRVSTTVDIAPLPDWLRPRVTPPPATPTGPGKAPNLGRIRHGDGHEPGYWKTVWKSVLDKVEYEDGERWKLVYNAARRLANLAVHDGAPWTEHEVLDELEAAAIRRREHTGKPTEPATARRNAQRGWDRGTHDGPDSLIGLGGAA